jgi:hypothetical protein
MVQLYRRVIVIHSFAGAGVQARHRRDGLDGERGSGWC